MRLRQPNSRHGVNYPRGGPVGLPLFLCSATLGVMRFRIRHFALQLLIGASLVGLSALPLSSPVNAQARDVPQTREQVQLSFAPLVKRVAPAVVNIFTRKNVQGRAVSPLFDDPLFRRFFGDDFLPFGQPRERMESSLGSGVIVRSDGLVVTNNHVIASGTKIIVALTDRREFEAEVVLADERTDLAVLKIDVGSEVLRAL